MSSAKNNSEQPFTKKALFILVALGLVATVGVAVTSIFAGDGRYQHSAGSNSFSKSALGHAALSEFLKADGRHILVSQYDTLNKIGNDSALLLIEPPARSASESQIDYLLDEAPTLLVLPKRTATAGLRRGWIGRAFLPKPAAAQTVARYVADGAEVVRPAHANHIWTHDIGLGGDPEVDDLQLVKSPLIEPIISTEDGILFGKLKDRFEGGQPVWLLADPDVLATHGLARGRNSEVALEIMDTVATGRNTFVIDEIIHGFSLEPSLSKAMFKQPFVFATLAALLALIFFLLALTRRFGAPARVENTLQNSKTVFIENTARILHLADKEKEALLRLMDDQALTIAEKLNAPRDLARKDLVAWLDETCRLREITPDFGTIRLRVDRIVSDDETKARRLMHQASQFYTWKQEILNETK